MSFIEDEDPFVTSPPSLLIFALSVVVLLIYLKKNKRKVAAAKLENYHFCFVLINYLFIFLSHFIIAFIKAPTAPKTHTTAPTNFLLHINFKISFCLRASLNENNYSFFRPFPQKRRKKAKKIKKFGFFHRLWC